MNFQVSVNGKERDIFVVNSKNELEARSVIDRMGAVDAHCYDLLVVELEKNVPINFQNCIMDAATVSMMSSVNENTDGIVS